MNADAHGGLNFDGVLEDELRRRLGKLKGPSPEVRQSAYQEKFLAGRRGSRHSIPHLFSGKVVLVVAGTAVLLAGGSVAAMVGWGSPTAEVWGRAVTTAIEECKDQLANGRYGISECVSAGAKERGQGRTNRNAGAASEDNARGAPGHGLVGPAVHPWPSDQPIPGAVHGTGPEPLATPGVAASNGRSPVQSGGHGQGQSRGHGPGGKAGNHGSRQLETGGNGKSSNGGAEKSGSRGGVKSKNHPPASPTPSP